LILSAQTGGGYMSLAAALQDILAPYATATIAAPLPGSVATYYRSMSRYARWLWADHAGRRDKSAAYRTISGRAGPASHSIHTDDRTAHGGRRCRHGQSRTQRPLRGGHARQALCCDHLHTGSGGRQSRFYSAA